MSDEKQVTESEVFKAIGHLDEATEIMKREIEQNSDDEEEVVSFFTTLGRIIRDVFMR